jgi:hypothetical protein
MRENNFGGIEENNFTVKMKKPDSKEPGSITFNY